MASPKRHTTSSRAALSIVTNAPPILAPIANLADDEFMRCFPLFVIALLICGLTTTVRAQRLHCDPCRHGFGKVDVGDSGTFNFQLSNIGSELLKIRSISFQNKAFSLGEFPLPVKLEPGASTQLPVIFTPTAVGYTYGTVTLISNADDSPLQMNLAGHGVNDYSPQLGVSPATLNFGDVTVGSNASLQATLTAPNAAITISSDQSTNPVFAIVGLTLPATIPAGGSLPVTIQFTPSGSGAASGQAAFISNAVDSPTLERLTGTGQAQGSHSVSLTWDPGEGNPVGYNIYRGTVSGGPYQKINTSLDPSTDYTDSTVVNGMTYFYVATEVNAQGEESGYSNIGEAVIP